MRRTGLVVNKFVLNEVPEHMAQEWRVAQTVAAVPHRSSMKFLSTWLRNDITMPPVSTPAAFLNEVPEHMAQE